MIRKPIIKEWTFMKKTILALTAFYSVTSFASSSLQDTYANAGKIKTLQELATYTVQVSTGTGDVAEQGGSWRCDGMTKNIELYHGISGNRTQGEIFGESFTFSQAGETVTAIENSGYDSRTLTFKKAKGRLIVEVNSDNEEYSYHLCSPDSR